MIMMKMTIPIITDNKDSEMKSKTQKNITNEFAEINIYPFSFLSTYFKNIEINWDDQIIKSYDDTSGEVLNESRFIKVDKKLIIFLKFIPFILIFLLSFRLPLPSNYEQFDLIDAIDWTKILSLFIATGMVYFGYRYTGSKYKAMFYIAIIYFTLFYLSLKIPYLVNLNMHLIVSIFFIWSIKEMYFLYKKGGFDQYYYLTDISKGKILYRKKFFSKNKAVLSRFSLGGYFFRITK